jgi:drug/metabolite transporter (DMT)-like permease
MSTPSSAALLAANRRGVIAMVAGMACFVTNDMLVKYVSQTLPAPQLILLRGLFATLLLLVVCHAMGLTRQLASLADRRVLIRACFDASATIAYLTSLFHLPLGNATAINMATPLFITLCAAVFFREKVGPARWGAVGAGFAGVMLVVQPSGAAFNAYALLCLAGALLNAGRDLGTRVIPPGIHSVVVTLSTAMAVTLLCGAWTATQPWQPVSPRELALLLAASLFLSAAYFLVIVSMRAGEMSLIAPFRYTGLLYALLLGYLVWGEVPNSLAWAGIALLVAAGLYVLQHERSRARAELKAMPE